MIKGYRHERALALAKIQPCFAETWLRTYHLSRKPWLESSHHSLYLIKMLPPPRTIWLTSYHHRRLTWPKSFHLYPLTEQSGNKVTMVKAVGGQISTMFLRDHGKKVAMSDPSERSGRWMWSKTCHACLKR